MRTVARFILGLSSLPAVSITLILIGSAGCYRHTLDRIPGVTGNVDQRDIPIPRGFYRREDSSWAFIQYSNGPGRFRSWVSEYVGEKQVRDLVNWYVEQMPRDGWFHKETIGDEKRVLRFTKDDHVATLTIYSDYNPRQDRFQTIIRAEVGPEPTESKELEEVLFPSDSQSPGIIQRASGEPAARPSSFTGAVPAGGPAPTPASIRAGAPETDQ